MTLPALRNVAYPGDRLDLDLCALFSTEEGRRVLAHLMERETPLVFWASEVRQAIRRVHEHCGTGSHTPS